jgi:regulator of protease activity HflC (stomatin/prohibitin superfamily)
MSIRTEDYTMSFVKNEGNKKGVDSISALTKEGLEVNLDITVLYRLEEAKASDIYKEVGLDYEEKIIRPVIRSTIREVIATYNSKDIYSEKREQATVSIHEDLNALLADRGIITEEVLLRNVKLPTNLANSIQEKLQAEQESQKYEFILQKEEKEKQRKLIEAEGQRDAQRIINESLTPNYLYYLYIKELKDREGTIYVPVSPDSGMPMFKDIK